MAEPKRRHEVRVRPDDQVERLAVALIHEEVPFEVWPEPNGWWVVRARIDPYVLQQLEQATRFPPPAIAVRYDTVDRRG